MWNRWQHYSRRPKAQAAKGGIKAQSKRGDFGRTWWAKRWIEILESFDSDERLSRGRSYARRGNVLSIEIRKGAVHASVQGTHARPYRVTIELPPFTADQWRQVIAALAGQALFAAKLSVGEMPPEIEEAFEGAGLSLFPREAEDLKTACTCADPSNPCKHIAAVYYLLAEELDRDPFLLFTLRGMTRDALIAGMGGKRVRASHRKAPEPTAQSEPLPSNPRAFWGSTDLPPITAGEIEPPPVAGALLRQLGGFPFWRGERPIDEVLLPTYESASRTGLEMLMRGEKERERRE